MIEVEHEITNLDGKLTKEYFWLNREAIGSKILSREEMVAAFKYVKENPDKFPEVDISSK